MELHSVIVCTIILLFSLPAMRGNDANDIIQSSIKEQRFGETRNDGILQQYWDDQNMRAESNIASSLGSNQKVIDMLLRIERKIDHMNRAKDVDQVHDVRDVINKLDAILQYVGESARVSIGPNSMHTQLVSAIDSANENLRNVVHDVSEVMENIRQSLQSLEKVAVILQDIDERIGLDESFHQFHDNAENDHRHLKNYSPKNKLIQNDRTGLSINTKITGHFERTERNKTLEEILHNILLASTVTPQPKRTYRAVKDILNCHDLTIRQNGIYKFGSDDDVSNESGRFFYERYCDFATDGPAWTVIQRRFTNYHNVIFNQTWQAYKLGFGQLDDEFWFGNDFIHKLTFENDMELRIVLEDENKQFDWADYSLFKMKSEEENYELVIEGFRGSAVNSLQYHNCQAFSTFDRRNDKDGNEPCAHSIGDGWWLKNCTAVYFENWLESRGMLMMVRPKRYRVCNGSKK